MSAEGPEGQILNQPDGLVSDAARLRRDDQPPKFDHGGRGRQACKDDVSDAVGVGLRLKDQMAKIGIGQRSFVLASGQTTTKSRFSADRSASMTYARSSSSVDRNLNAITAAPYGASSTDASTTGKAMRRRESSVDVITGVVARKGIDSARHYRSGLTPETISAGNVIWLTNSR